MFKYIKSKIHKIIKLLKNKDIKRSISTLAFSAEHTHVKDYVKDQFALTK